MLDVFVRPLEANLNSCHYESGVAVVGVQSARGQGVMASPSPSGVSPDMKALNSATEEG